MQRRALFVPNCPQAFDGGRVLRISPENIQVFDLRLVILAGIEIPARRSCRVGRADAERLPPVRRGDRLSGKEGRAMRASAIVLLLLAGCGGPGETNGAAGPRESTNAAAAAAPLPILPEVGATLALSAAGADRCSAKWNGEAVTRAQLLDRAAAAIERAIAAVGGIENISAETIPVVRVEAPADMGFACVDTMLAAVQRAGFPRVILAPIDESEAALASFPLTEIGPPPPAAIVRIGAGGRMTWNQEAVDLARLTERARAIGGVDMPPAPPGELEIRPALEASFGSVHAAVRAARQGNVQATLLPPSVAPRP